MRFGRFFVKFRNDKSFRIILPVIVVVVLVVLIFIGFKDDANTFPDTQNTTSGTIRIPNKGGLFGGHTPIGFQGQGTGIFVGDNLNPNFPNGDGVQAFLAFDISALQISGFDTAILTSNNLHINGSPFTDLGNIIVEEVQYDSFSSKLWDIESQGDVCVLERGTTTGTISCDIEGTLSDAIRDGKSTLQLRLRFETVSDNDNSADLALFYRTSSNTNDSGIFIIEVTEQNVGDISTPSKVGVVLHLVKESGDISNVRDEENVLALFSNTERIWIQANVEFDIEVVETIIDPLVQLEVLQGKYQGLRTANVEDGKLHIYYTRTLGRTNGIALGNGVAVVSDTTTVNDYRATAHEIGHLFGLSHTSNSRNRLMFRGANGEILSTEEIAVVTDFLNRSGARGP